METINHALEVIVGYVWNLPLVVLLIGSGLLFSFILLPGLQVRGFMHAIQVVRGKFDDPDEPGEISHFQALTTALSATVGLGNIAGVAVAIHMGGPGATFWMILAGLVGMATKFAECTLAVKYRDYDKKTRKVFGGPMHYIEKGLGKKWRPMALFFSFAAIFASFGSANMFQTNQVAVILKSNFGVEPWITGVVLAVMTGLVIIGGIRRIGKVTSILIPVMGGFYVLGAGIVILMNFEAVPALLWQIVSDAFTGSAATGGFTGIALSQVVIQGVRRACFSNEAGLGSAPIAHAAATTDEPVREGVVALLEPFIDTVVICTMTALVILLSGAWTQDANGVELTAIAFDSAIPGFGSFFVPIAVSLFAYSTLLSWSYYGEVSVEHIVGPKNANISKWTFPGAKAFPLAFIAVGVVLGMNNGVDALSIIVTLAGMSMLPFAFSPIIGYKILFCFLAVMGAVWSIDPVLAFSDIMLGLMVVPNLIAVWMLLPVLKKETQKYFKKLARGDFEKDAVLARKHRQAHGDVNEL